MGYTTVHLTLLAGPAKAGSHSGSRCQRLRTHDEVEFEHGPPTAHEPDSRLRKIGPHSQFFNSSHGHEIGIASPPILATKPHLCTIGLHSHEYIFAIP